MAERYSSSSSKKDIIVIIDDEKKDEKTKDILIIDEDEEANELEKDWSLMVWRRMVLNSSLKNITVYNIMWRMTKMKMMKNSGGCATTMVMMKIKIIEH